MAVLNNSDYEIFLTSVTQTHFSDSLLKIQSHTKTTPVGQYQQDVFLRISKMFSNSELQTIPLSIFWESHKVLIGIRLFKLIWPLDIK